MDKKQSEMKEQISHMLSKKDYYDILGIQKTATQTEIKKSYKKLALRFHPDKNSTEGSKDVFKKVSQAYSVLINVQQKSRYDQFGPEQQIQARHRQQNRAYNYHEGQGDQQFDQFDDIFRAFFGMNGLNQMNGNVRFRRYEFNMGGNNNNNQQNRNNGFNLSYLFIILFFLYAIAPIFKSQPYHSLTASSEYRFRTTTNILGVSYYVREGFEDEARKDARFKQQIDFEVDVNYFNSLRRDCDQASQQKKKYEYMAYQYQGQQRQSYLKHARGINLSSCERIRRLSEQNSEYISQIYYYR